MKTYNLAKDIKVFCVTADSFPEGVLKAFQTLENLHPDIRRRTFYGISRPDRTGRIVYKAAAEEARENEGKEYGLESFVIPAGTYMTETVTDFMKDPANLIGQTFRRLLDTPDLDRSSFCLEWYKSPEEVMCMVKLNDK